MTPGDHFPPTREEIAPLVCEFWKRRGAARLGRGGLLRAEWERELGTPPNGYRKAPMAGMALYWQQDATHCHPSPAPLFGKVEVEEYCLDRALLVSDAATRNHCVNAGNRGHP
jgi:hypothetical protein